MKYDKEKELKINLRANDLYSELMKIDGVPSKVYGQIIQRIDNAVETLKKIAREYETSLKEQLKK